MDHHASRHGRRPDVAGGPRAAGDPPAEPDEVGRRLFAQSCAFVAGAASSDALPALSLPEVAFAGRSNVGKSSLLNALTGRKALARTSSTPGRTQQLNFFRLGDRLMLVDLPGYGYARASRSSAADWTRLVARYLKGRASLRRLLLLVDARHGLKPSDGGLMDTLDRAAVSFQIVLTKVDRITASELQACEAGLRTALGAHSAAYPWVAATSARDGRGLAELRAALASLADGEGLG